MLVSRIFKNKTAVTRLLSVKMLKITSISQTITALALTVAVQVASRIFVLYCCMKEIINYPILSVENLCYVPILSSSLIVFDLCVKNLLLDIKKYLKVYYQRF